MQVQRDTIQKPAQSSSSPQWALPTFDQKGVKLTTATFTAGVDFTIPAGDVGDDVAVSLSIQPILGDYGRTGAFSNSSFSFGGDAANTFTDEVAFIVDSNGLGGDASSLAEGEYMIDYEAGIVYGKKADSGTTGTCTYSYLSSLTA